MKTVSDDRTAGGDRPFCTPTNLHGGLVRSGFEAPVSSRGGGTAPERDDPATSPT